MLKRRIKRDSSEVSRIIQGFLLGTGDRWSWDDFISIPIENKRLDEIRLQCLHLSKEYPPQDSEKYCNEEGVDKLRSFIEELRSFT